MYQQQVKGLSAPHHFILNINNRTFTKSSFGWMESRPWIARPTIHQNRPQNSIELSERISLISILTKILTPVYLENIWFSDKTWIQSTELSVKSKRKTPLSPEIRDAFPSPLKWIVLGVVSDYLLLVRWHSTRSRCSISGQRRPDNRATPTRKLVFNGAVHKYTRLVRAKSATNQLKIKESSVGLPFKYVFVLRTIRGAEERGCLSCCMAAIDISAEEALDRRQGSQRFQELSHFQKRQKFCKEKCAISKLDCLSWNETCLVSTAARWSGDPAWKQLVWR